ncbi:MAG: HD domain-containing protein ['Waltheria sp.' little leaf phytoplasma]|nr:HD domain-containing protein ['Waltheria sp.' little leaf phytoplasma]
MILESFWSKEPRKFTKIEVIKDPVYGYIYLEYLFLEELINTRLFQRLRRIKQLGCVHMVFPGAEHSRFTHSLGVYELSRRFLEFHKFQLIEKKFSLRNKLILLTASLLHDIGHSSYSHIFEHVFGINHEDKTIQMIINNKEIISILDQIDTNFKYDVAEVIKNDKNSKRFTLLKQLLTSQLDFDRLDYLKRDSFFAGVSYGYIDSDRLIGIMEITNAYQVPQTSDFPTDELVIIFRNSGLSSIENYLMSRYYMYRQVYCHSKIILFAIILEQIFKRIKFLIKNNYLFELDITLLKNFFSNKESLDLYSKIDDFYINSLIVAFQDSQDLILSHLCQDFLHRRIVFWKCILNVSENYEFIKKIQQKYRDNSVYYTYYYDDYILRDTYRENVDNIGEQILIGFGDITDNIIKPLSLKSVLINNIMFQNSYKDMRNFFYYRDFND